MNRTRAIVVAAVVVLSGVAVAPAGGEIALDSAGEQGRPPTDSVLVVDAHGDGEYASIQSALDAASDGDTVRVRPGTYRESVTVDANVTLVAPRGATLDGSAVDADEGVVVEYGSRAAPRIDGFTVTGFAIGVDAQSTAGAWIVRNTTIRNASFQGLGAGASTGDWLVRNVTVTGPDASVGIAAASSDGNWTVRDAVVENADLFGVDAADAAGDWTVRNATVERIGGVGVRALVTGGDWTVVNTTVRDTSIGVLAQSSRGNWTVRGSVVANTSVSGNLIGYREGIGVSARNTSGSWRVRGTRFADNSEAAVVAPDAAPAGDATGNSWGGDGPEEGDCRGNVDCGIPSRTVGGTSTTTDGSGSSTTDGGGSSTTASGTRTSGASTLSPTATDQSVAGSPSVGDEWGLSTMTTLGGATLVVLVGVAVLVARRRL